MIDIIVFLTLMAMGYFFGRYAESKHFKSIIKREDDYKNILAFSERLPPTSVKLTGSALVGGNVVVSIDYFKKIVAGLRMLFGGRVASYESLLERARREAILRMKEAAREKGAAMVVNVKLETASITKGRKQQVGSIEVFAYGTALFPVR